MNIPHHEFHPCLLSVGFHWTSQKSCTKYLLIKTKLQLKCNKIMLKNHILLSILSECKEEPVFLMRPLVSIFLICNSIGNTLNQIKQNLPKKRSSNQKYMLGKVSVKMFYHALFPLNRSRGNFGCSLVEESKSLGQFSVFKIRVGTEVLKYLHNQIS